MRIVRREFPVVIAAPGKCCNYFNSILPDGFENLRHVAEIVLAAGRIKELIRERHLRLAKDREAELRDSYRHPPGVVEIVEVAPEPMSQPYTFTMVWLTQYGRYVDVEFLAQSKMLSWTPGTGGQTTVAVYGSIPRKSPVWPMYARSSLLRGTKSGKVCLKESG
ncbi:hypothetical protein TOPH_02798 [Tolypocladium ophioglossoides CBS 100239]|uniref:Uncharacterized protein n=1 Tax=Tolypocladium ophioglossoides (strain CBS 100239) TaxID=1163406 RepID=A0A0L0NFQ3_TOLOC|nr:hypothetical protein TOPH_02798 [Tolypocladium ophioglossoides CBS 100239]